MGFGLMGFGLIFWILLIAALVWGVKYFADHNQRSHGDNNGNGSKRPIDILKERYARGELTKEEFAERKRVLDEG